MHIIKRTPYFYPWVRILGNKSHVLAPIHFVVLTNIQASSLAPYKENFDTVHRHTHTPQNKVLTIILRGKIEDENMGI